MWDLDDAANELSAGVAGGVRDNQNLESNTVLDLWSLLPNGTQNGGNDETNLNMMDYWWEALGVLVPGAWDTAIFQNCLDDQAQ